MAHIIVHNTKKKLSNDSKCNATILCKEIVQGPHFLEFIDSQMYDEINNKRGITSIGVKNLRSETVDILSHCNPHDATDNIETTHLVVGYVQSGKTMSFTALTALACDNNYRLIVYLAGSKTNLLNQTTERLRNDLTKGNLNNRNVFKIHKNPTINDLQQIVGNLFLNNTTLLLPILKHYKHINQLTNIFNCRDFKDAFAGETVLIIDDEADQVSLNTYARKNSKKIEHEEDEKSQTYRSIFKMRAALSGNSYIQYTATPQANVLISMSDMLSPKSHTLLTPGEDYIGGIKFFGRAKNHELFNGRLIQEIPQKDVFHPKKNLLKRMPNSLKDALIMHILAVAIVVKYFKKDGIDFLSMMVHPAVQKKHNAKFKKWIENQLKTWRDAITREDGNDDKQDLMKRFEELFPRAIEFYNEDERPEYNAIKPYLKMVLFSWKVYLVNTDENAQTNIDWGNYDMPILVGAEMLNRGFTIENLATTYMPRYSTGPANADTIQQRCRFFGYKKEYIASCRVYLPNQTMQDYLDYIEHEEELRSTLKHCSNLVEAERKIMLSPRMKATRSNVLPVSVVTSRLRGRPEMRNFESSARIRANTQFVEQFIRQHEKEFEDAYNGDTPDRRHRKLKLSIQDAIYFLSEFQSGSYTDATLKAATVRYIRYLSEQQGDNALECVYLIQMAYKHEEDRNLRKRKFDNNELKLKVGLAAGPDPRGVDIYPGDDKIVEEDSITIQLYHIYLDGASLDFEQNAYTLAINYPDKFATSYVANEQKYQDSMDEDDEDDEDNDR